MSVNPSPTAAAYFRICECKSRLHVRETAELDPALPRQRATRWGPALGKAGSGKPWVPSEAVKFGLPSSKFSCGMSSFMPHHGARQPGVHAVTTTTLDDSISLRLRRGSHSARIRRT